MHAYMCLSCDSPGHAAGPAFSAVAASDSGKLEGRGTPPELPKPPGGGQPQSSQPASPSARSSLTGAPSAGAETTINSCAAHLLHVCFCNKAMCCNAHDKNEYRDMDYMQAMQLILLAHMGYCIYRGRVLHVVVGMHLHAGEGDSCEGVSVVQVP